MRILIDIDGVCADFVSPVLAATNHILGTNFTEEDVTVWDMMEALDVPPRQREMVDAIIGGKGFCSRIKPYAGAVKGLAKLRNLGDVVAVTMPFNSEHWEYERRQWLVNELGFDRKHIISTSGKAPIEGDFLIEDKTTNLIEWQEEDWTGRTGILFKRPWNVDDIGVSWNGPAVNDWKHLVAFLKSQA